MTRLRVRWSEVDPQSIVFNANYLAYVDTASTDYWRAIGAPYPDGLSTLGGDVYVRKATLEYTGPARFDDVLDIGLRCQRVGRSSLGFAWAIMRDGATLVHGEIVSVYVDTATNRPTQVPRVLRSAIEDFESGKAMFDVRVAPWKELEQDAQPLRAQVFVQELAVPPNVESDGEDPLCTHAVAYNRFGVPVGTARLHPNDGSIARLGRFAVKRPLRGAGVGRSLLAHLTQRAREQGFRSAIVDALPRAVPFFARHGWQPVGEPFLVSDLPHQRLDRALSVQ